MTEKLEQVKQDLEKQTWLAEDRLNQLKYLQQDFDNDCKLEGGERARLAGIKEYYEDAILAKTLDGIITRWNAGAEHIYGYSAQEIIGKSISVLVPPDHRDDTCLILERIRNGEPVVRYEILRRKEDGRLIKIALTASAVREAQNHIIGVSTIAHDITQRKLSEEAKHASKIRYHHLFKTAQDGILILDAGTGYRTMRLNVRQIFGDLGTTQLIQRSMEDITRKGRTGERGKPGEEKRERV